MPTSPDNHQRWADGEWNQHRSSRKDAKRRRQRWAEIRAAMAGHEEAPTATAPEVPVAPVVPVVPVPPVAPSALADPLPYAGPPGPGVGTPAAGSPTPPDLASFAPAPSEPGPSSPPAAPSPWASTEWDTRVPEPALPSWTRRDTLILVGLTVLLAAWLIAAVWVGAPVLGRSWSLVGLVPLGGAGLAGLAVRRHLARRDLAPVRALLAAGTMLLVLLGSFGWGVTHSVVIDGRLYLDTSTEARAHRLAAELVADRAYFTRVDALLALDPSAARTRYLELKPAQLAMEAIADHWNNTAPGDLPAGRFMPAVEHARAAAYFGGLALERKQSLLGVQDQQIAAELDSYRSSFITSALQLSDALRPLARRYGAVPGHPGRG